MWSLMLSAAAVASVCGLGWLFVRKAMMARRIYQFHNEVDG